MSGRRSRDHSPAHPPSSSGNTGAGSGGGGGGGGGVPVTAHALINAAMADAGAAGGAPPRSVFSSVVASTPEEDSKLSYPLSSDDSVSPGRPATAFLATASASPAAPVASALAGAPQSITPSLVMPVSRHVRSSSDMTAGPPQRSASATPRPPRQMQVSLPGSSGGSPAGSPTPFAAHSSSANAAAASKRKAQVAQFIRSGEANLVFREKAPSIIPNETGIFLAPPSAMSRARQAAFEAEQARVAQQQEIDFPSSGSMSIPTHVRRTSGAHSPVGSSGGNSPRKPSLLSASPMGMSSRQLMWQLSSSASNSAAGLSTAAATHGHLSRHQRRGSGATSFPMGPTRFARSDSRGSEDESYNNSASNSPRATRRFSFFGAKDDSAAKPGLRSSTPPLPQRKGSIARLGSSSPRLRPHAAPRAGRSARAAAGTASSEEARRREEEREASTLAPFLEARGNEDFVTYDLTRQQDYHKQRKDVIKERFNRWARGHQKVRPTSTSGGEHKERDSKKDLELDEEAHVTSRDAPRIHENENTNFKPTISSDEDDSDEDDDDEDDGGEGGTSVYASCRRTFRRTCNNPCGRGLVKAFMLGQSWIICGLIGALTGFLAALIDLATQWAIDLKSGYCSDALHLSNAFCCAGSPQFIGVPSSQPLLLMCDQWKSWDSNSGITSTLVDVTSAFFAAYTLYIALGVAMALLSAWLVLTFAPHAAGSGIPEIKTILGGVVIKRYLGAWTLLIKCMALILSVGSGLSLGKEGGYVHISCCLANILCRFFPEFRNNQYKKNEAISAAAAAGMSVAFGAPVGGVLFCLEEISSFFPHRTMWRAFFCAICASMVLQSIDPYQQGRLVLFLVDYNKTWYWFEMFPFMLIGVLGGLLGSLFIQLNTWLNRFRRDSFVRAWPLLEVATVTLLTVVIKYLSAYLRGNNNAVLASLFADCKSDAYYDPLSMCDPGATSQTIFELLFVAAVTFACTIAAWSLSVPGGVFIPALIIGGAYGRAIGTAMRAWQSSRFAPALFEGCNPFTPGIYALVGAASMLGGVTRMTVCLVVIMFELTSTINYLLPIMVGLMFAKLVGDAFDRRSIFEAHLVLHEYPFLNAKDRIPPRIRVADAMSRELLALPMHGHTVESLTDQLALLGELQITGFPIVTTLKDRFIVGYINRSELYTALCLALRSPLITPQTRCYFAMLSLRFPRNDPYVDLRPWLHPSPVQVVEHTPLYRVHDMFKKMGLRYVLVTNFGKLTGILTKKDIMAVIAREEQAKKRQKKPTLKKEESYMTLAPEPIPDASSSLNHGQDANPPFDYVRM